MQKLHPANRQGATMGHTGCYLVQCVHIIHQFTCTNTTGHFHFLHFRSKESASKLVYFSFWYPVSVLYRCRVQGQDTQHRFHTVTLCVACPDSECCYNGLRFLITSVSFQWLTLCRQEEAVSRRHHAVTRLAVKRYLTVHTATTSASYLK